MCICLPKGLGPKPTPKPEKVTTKTVHCPYQASQPRNSPVPPHFISKTTKSIQSSKATQRCKPQVPVTSTSVTAMYGKPLQPWLYMYPPMPGYMPPPGWTPVSPPDAHMYEHIGYPLGHSMVTQPLAQPVSTFLPLSRPPPSRMRTRS